MSIKETATTITLIHPDNADTSVAILKYGATVYSWKLNGHEQLWLSEGAQLDGSKPVRGGIPLVFPVFGKNNTKEFLKELPQHGFARTSTWKFNGKIRSYPSTIQFELNEKIADQELAKLWPFDFKVLLNIQLGYDHLKTSVQVTNNSTIPFDFNWLFHTYHNVDVGIDNIYVKNLTTEKTHDNLTGKNAKEVNVNVIIAQEVERRYLNVPTSKTVQVINKRTHNPIASLIRENLADVVVWNPWIEKSASMVDFTPKAGYKHMLCLEPGEIDHFITLKPKKTWKASQYMY